MRRLTIRGIFDLDTWEVGAIRSRHDGERRSGADQRGVCSIREDIDLVAWAVEQTDKMKSVRLWVEERQ